MLQERQHRHEDERNEDHRDERGAAVCHVALNSGSAGEMRLEKRASRSASTLQPPLADSTTATRHDLTNVVAPAA